MNCKKELMSMKKYYTLEIIFSIMKMKGKEKALGNET
jgi:hypothetical protein